MNEELFKGMDIEQQGPTRAQLEVKLAQAERRLKHCKGWLEATLREVEIKDLKEQLINK